MPKLQSANERLKLMSRFGCFLYYLFLLFKLCCATPLLQEMLGNHSLQCVVQLSTTSAWKTQGFTSNGIVVTSVTCQRIELWCLWKWKYCHQERLPQNWRALKAPKGKTATNVRIKSLYRPARVCGFPQMTKPATDSKVTLPGQGLQSQSDSRVKVCVGSAAGGCQGELRDVIAKLTHTHQQKPLKAMCHLLPGKQEDNRWKPEKQNRQDTSSSLKDPRQSDVLTAWNVSI